MKEEIYISASPMGRRPVQSLSQCLYGNPNAEFIYFYTGSKFQFWLFPYFDPPMKMVRSLCGKHPVRNLAGKPTILMAFFVTSLRTSMKIADYYHQ
jgi:hypothetical protein